MFPITVDSGIAAQGAAIPAAVALAVSNVSKAFPGVRALDTVSIAVRRGTVHGLVGENGAGKSTLLKMCSGADIPDAGSIRVGGRELPYGEPNAIFRLGLSTLYQEVNLVPGLSVLDNVLLGMMPRTAGFWVDRRSARRKFDELCEFLGVAIDPDQKPEEMPLARRRIIEILRALARGGDVICMDEPTAALGPADRDHLVAVIRRLRDTGRSIVFVSHDLDEVLGICDEVTVLREGRVIDTRPASHWATGDLVKAMVGREVEPVVRPSRGAEQGGVLLAANGIRLAGYLDDVSFELRKGEILGIAGLVGAGRSELLRALAGAEPKAQGQIILDGVPRPLPRSVREALGLGIVLAPEERRSEGLILEQGAAKNAVLTDLAAASGGVLFRKDRQTDTARRVTEPLGFDPSRLGAPAGTFSGGNQQKLVLGKCLHRNPKILLLDEPTRGIDIGAKAEIAQHITRMSLAGLSVIVVSSELEELPGLCHRILVLSRGRISSTLPGTAKTQEILAAMFGQGKKEDAP